MGAKYDIILQMGLCRDSFRRLQAWHVDTIHFTFPISTPNKMCSQMKTLSSLHGVHHRKQICILSKTVGFTCYPLPWDAISTSTFIHVACNVALWGSFFECLIVNADGVHAHLGLFFMIARNAVDMACSNMVIIPFKWPQCCVKVETKTTSEKGLSNCDRVSSAQIFRVGIVRWRVLFL